MTEEPWTGKVQMTLYLEGDCSGPSVSETFAAGSSTDESAAQCHKDPWDDDDTVKVYGLKHYGDDSTVAVIAYEKSGCSGASVGITMLADVCEYDNDGYHYKVTCSGKNVKYEKFSDSSCSSSDGGDHFFTAGECAAPDGVKKGKMQCFASPAEADSYIRKSDDDDDDGPNLGLILVNVILFVSRVAH